MSMQSPLSLEFSIDGNACLLLSMPIISSNISFMYDPCISFEYQTAPLDLALDSGRPINNLARIQPQINTVNQCKR